MYEIPRVYSKSLSWYHRKCFSPNHADNIAVCLDSQANLNGQIIKYMINILNII